MPEAPSTARGVSPQPSGQHAAQARPVRVLPGLLFLGLVLVALLHESLLGHKGLVPADGLLFNPPWAREPGFRPLNYLLVDQYAFFLPVKEFVYQQFRQGSFPLWNPHLDCGIPTLASMQTALLYPINLLLLPLGPFVAGAIGAFLKLLLAGAGTMLYMRRIGASAAAALLSAQSFALCGFITVWLGHPHVNSAVLLPALFYCIEMQLGSGARPRGWAVLGLVYAAVLLGGHPPSIVIVTLLTGLYAVLRLGEKGRTRRAGFLLAFAASLGAGVLAAAVQLLPFLEYYRESSLPLSSQTLQRWSTHLQPGELLYFLMPLLGGSPRAGHEELRRLLGLAGSSNFNEYTAYVGVVALFLAMVALAARHCRVGRIHALLGVISLLIVLGVAPIPQLQRLLPVLDDVTPTRLLLGVDWSLAVLAGLGLDRVLRMSADQRARGLAGGASLFALATLGVTWLLMHGGRADIADGSARSFLLQQLALLAAGLAVVLLLCWRRIGGKAIAGLCIAWSAFDLCRFAYDYNPAVPARQYFPLTPAIEYLQKREFPARVLGLGVALPPNAAAAYGLYDTRGVDFMVVRRYEELVSGQAGDFNFWQGGTHLPASFRLLNARYLLVPRKLPAVPAGFDAGYNDEIAVYRFRQASERAMIVTDYSVLDDTAMLRVARDDRFDPAATVLLESEPTPAPGPLRADVATTRATIVDYAPDNVRVEVSTPHAAFLVLLDTHFPGWTARVDGHEAPLLRADYTFRAVAIPAGRATVEFRYEPLSIRAGLCVSAITTLLLLALCCVQRARKPARS